MGVKYTQAEFESRFNAFGQAVCVYRNWYGFTNFLNTGTNMGIGGISQVIYYPDFDTNDHLPITIAVNGDPKYAVSLTWDEMKTNAPFHPAGAFKLYNWLLRYWGHRMLGWNTVYDTVRYMRPVYQPLFNVGLSGTWGANTQTEAQGRATFEASREVIKPMDHRS